MLTGDPPFTGSTAQAVGARVVTESPRPLVPQRHTIPPHVEAAVLTALEKLPADRFTSAAQFADALGNRSYVATAPMASAAAAAAPGAGTRGRRGAAVYALAALSVLLAAAALWGWLRPGPAPVVHRYSLFLRSSE